MNTRIEIYKNGIWESLFLEKREEIKYNAVINRIGNVASREIGHTNTFKVPSTWDNLKILDINIFNPKDLARAFNDKYPAKYYIENRLIQTGFVVINNTFEGEINLNFIDKSLGIVEKWGATTFKQLLQSSEITRPSDYQAAINEMVGYNMDKGNVLTSLSKVGSRGYNLALFPNTLNAIGDKWQKNIDDVRMDDSFNPYQSRPIFNAKSLIDLAVESFGYKPIYNDTINWDKISKTYITNSGLADDGLEEGGIVSESFLSTNAGSSKIIYSGFTDYPDPYDNDSQYNVEENHIILYDKHSPSVNYKKPSDIAGFSIVDASKKLFSYYSSSGDNDYSNDPVVYVPNTAAGNFGTIEFDNKFIEPSYPNNIFGSRRVFYIFIWKDSSGNLIYENSVDLENRISESDILPRFENRILHINKEIFGIPPNAGGQIVGIIMANAFDYIYYSTEDFQKYEEAIVHTSRVTEGVLPKDTVSYDDNGQFLADNIDLTYAAPTKSIKSLLSALMQKEGILMNIDNKKKEILFFSYELYKKNRDSSKFSDWSSYIQKYSKIQFDTNYGNSYGQLNEVGLLEPYAGNTYFYKLENQGGNSKYKEYSTNYNKVFNDINGVHKINNTNSPYLEYKNTRVGLVEENGVVGDLTQVRFDKKTQGTISNLPHIVNVNYLNAPRGIDEWYRIVDNSVKISAKFLLPLQEIIDLKLYEPIYVEHLGGFFIIEEVSEYVDNVTPVVVKLIKLLD